MVNEMSILSVEVPIMPVDNSRSDYAREFATRQNELMNQEFARRNMEMMRQLADNVSDDATNIARQVVANDVARMDIANMRYGIGSRTIALSGTLTTAAELQALTSGGNTISVAYSPVWGHNGELHPSNNRAINHGDLGSRLGGPGSEVRYDYVSATSIAIDAEQVDTLMRIRKLLPDLEKMVDEWKLKKEEETRTVSSRPINEGVREA